MAVAGARAASETGVNRAEHVWQLLVEHNITVASGFARGLDTAVQHTAISSTGQTTALLGTGVANANQQAIEF